MKAKYDRNVRRRGKELADKVGKHVAKAVIKKKEELEQVATQVFVDTFQKFNFRRALARRIKIR